MKKIMSGEEDGGGDCITAHGSKGSLFCWLETSDSLPLYTFVCVCVCVHFPQYSSNKVTVDFNYSQTQIFTTVLFVGVAAFRHKNEWRVTFHSKTATQLHFCICKIVLSKSCTDNQKQPSGAQSYFAATFDPSPLVRTRQTVYQC